MREGLQAGAGAPDALIVVDDDRRYLRLNSSAETVLGDGAESILRSRIDDYTSFQFQHLLPDLWSVLEHDGALAGAYEVQRRDGSLTWIEFTATSELFDAQHLIIVRETQPGAHPPLAGYALVDPEDAEVVEATPEFCRLIGRSRAAILSDGAGPLLDRTQRDRVRALVRRMGREGGPPRQTWFPIERPEGTRYLQVTFTAVRGAGTTPARVLVSLKGTAAPPVSAQALTAREIEVLRLVTVGLTTPQIAEHLIISPRTADAHLRSIYAKLGVTSRSAATRAAIEHKLA